jgi:hypothetical protein
MAAVAHRATERLRGAHRPYAASPRAADAGGHEDDHAQALEQLQRLQAIEAQESTSTEDLEELDRIESEGKRVNGLNLANRARQVRQRIEAAAANGGTTK